MNKNKPRLVKSRDTSPSNRIALGRVLSTIDLSCLGLIHSCEKKPAFFNKIISDSRNLMISGTDETRTVHKNDAPRISDKLKRLKKGTAGLTIWEQW